MARSLLTKVQKLGAGKASLERGICWLHVQALLLALQCLSFDFVGTCLDDSSEDFGTIQVSFNHELSNGQMLLIADCSSLR